MGTVQHHQIATSGSYLVSIHFAVPSYTRWNCPVIFRNPRLARRVEAILASVDCVQAVKANPRTGRLRIAYRSEDGGEKARQAGEQAVCVAVEEGKVAAKESAKESSSSPERSKLIPRRKALVWIVKGSGVIVVGMVVRASLGVFSKVATAAGLGIFTLSTVAVVRKINLMRADNRQGDRDYTLKNLWLVAAAHRKRLAAGAGLVVSGRALQVAAIGVVGLIIDSLLGTAIVTVSLASLATSVLLLVLGCSLCDYLSKNLWMGAAHQIAEALRNQLYDHVQSLEMAAITDRGRSRYLALLTEDIGRIDLMFESTWAAMREIAYAGASMICFYYVQPAFAGMVSVALPGLLLLSYSLEKTIRPRFAALRNEAGEMHKIVASTLDGLETTRAFAAESEAAGLVRTASARYRDEQAATVRVVSTYDPAMWGIANGIRLATCIAAGLFTAAGGMSVGTYVVLVTLATSLALPLRGISRDFPHILATLTSLSRVFRGFELPIEDRDGGRSIDSSQVAGRIHFEQVVFHYPSGPQIFEDFSVEIPARQVTAFVGASGSGKSTVARLILRFFDPDSGQIRLDDSAVTELSRAEMRRCVGYVGQEVFLFNASVRENIAFGQPDLPMKKIVAAAKLVGAHELIESLPDGYSTVVGDRGAKLSGGERQRIGIARAVVLDRPIVILDEATASLDAESEAELVLRLGERLADHTVIVIAHRLSAVRHAHHIHVLSNGSITESGKHEALLAKKGQYAKYWKLQTQQT